MVSGRLQSGINVTGTAPGGISSLLLAPVTRTLQLFLHLGQTQTIRPAWGESIPTDRKSNSETSPQPCGQPGEVDQIVISSSIMTGLYPPAGGRSFPGGADPLPFIDGLTLDRRLRKWLFLDWLQCDSFPFPVCCIWTKLHVDTSYARARNSSSDTLSLAARLVPPLQSFLGLVNNSTTQRHSRCSFLCHDRIPLVSIPLEFSRQARHLLRSS